MGFVGLKSELPRGSEHRLGAADGFRTAQSQIPMAPGPIAVERATMVSSPDVGMSPSSLACPWTFTHARGAFGYVFQY